MDHCIRHFEEPVAGVCRTCQSPFCDRCLVYVFGPDKAPFCIGCALNASGVRCGGRSGRAPAAAAAVVGSESAATPKGGTALARRTARAERRAAKSEARDARKGRVPAPPVVEVGDLAPTDRYVPAPGALTPHRYEPSAIDQLV